MEKEWSYKNYEIKEGLKPGSEHFQYFFMVSKNNEKQCNYCVWIEDEALSRFDQGKDFHAIISSQSEAWNVWVKGNIDAKDFQNKVLKFGKAGEEEVDLAEIQEHIRMEEKTIKEKNGQEQLLPCTTAPDAEQARAHDEDEPCDDGRAGVVDKE